MLVRHHVDHTTIGAHLQAPEFAFALKHRVTGEFTEHVVNHLPGTDCLATGDAIERFSIIEHNLRFSRVTQEQAREK